MKEHEFLAMMEIQRGMAQSLSHIAQGLAAIHTSLAAIVMQGEQAMEMRTEVTLDPSRLPILDGTVLGDPGPAASGWVQVTASDGNPIEPTQGSSFKLEGGLMMVCVDQNFYNAHEECFSEH